MDLSLTDDLTGSLTYPNRQLMKLFGRNIISTISAALAAALMIVFASCQGLVYDDLDPCDEGLRLRFVYDYNMEFANAFPSQVDCLTLLVYDKDGKYKETRTVTDLAQLSDENWRMTLDLPAGTYNLLAYGGMACRDASFEFRQEPSPAVDMQAMEVFLRPTLLTSPVGTKLHNLFYGALKVTVPENSTDYTDATVEMMKDTNNLRIILQHADGSSVNNADFTFTLTADNTLFDWQNNVIPTKTITYWPWTRGQALAGTNPEDNDSDVEVAYAEFSTSRFIAGSDPRLEIKRVSDGGTVFSIPLVNYLLLLKSQEFAKMGAQEFLDRESRWNMIFFLDRNNYWISTTIVINGWVVRINDSEL